MSALTWVSVAWVIAPRARVVRNGKRTQKNRPVRIAASLCDGFRGSEGSSNFSGLEYENGGQLEKRFAPQKEQEEKKQEQDAFGAVSL
jgi:hypothetical protein